MIDTPFPYSLAGQWDKLVRALAIHESHEDPHPRGSQDGGRAFGILQQHAPFMQRWYFSMHQAPEDITWPEVQILAAANFIDHYSHLGWSQDDIIQAYNKGVEAFIKGQRNPTYLSDVSQILSDLGNG